MPCLSGIARGEDYRAFSMEVSSPLILLLYCPLWHAEKEGRAVRSGGSTALPVVFLSHRGSMPVCC